MYCIITDNEKLIKCAKRLGEEIVKVEKSVVIQNKNGKKYYENTGYVVDNFLRAFPNIVMETLGTKALKYILHHQLGCHHNLYKTVYPKLAKKFKTTQDGIASAIMGVYSKCITNMPDKYKPFFDKYECSVHWRYEYSFDFVKACQDYIGENYKSLSKNSISPEKVKNFMDSFLSINKETLGYKYVKYILENQIECTLETRGNVYKKLALKFEKDPSAVSGAISNLFTKVMKNHKQVPKDFIEFYKELSSDTLKPVGERSIEFVQIIQRYLEDNLV